MQVALKNKIKSKIKLVTGLLLLSIISAAALNAGEINHAYRESVDLHVGRTIYNAGESIWYKAYAISNQQELFSQPLYVELVNEADKHILGQILKIENGSASSGIRIPDTLSSGQYRVVAYTNWMRNFSTEYFASFPLVIYNQYDEESNEFLKVPSIYEASSTSQSSSLSLPEFRPGNKIEIPINKLLVSETDLVSASLSVFKQSPDMRPELDSVDDSLSLRKSEAELVVFSSPEKSFAPESPSNFEFPVEDIGILYSGRLINPENNSPISNVDVRMALEDSLAVMMASKTDSEGKFAFLIEGKGQNVAYLNLYMRESRLSGNYQILLDEKFHYVKGATQANSQTEFVHADLNDYLQDEAERVIIQRAFDRLDNTHEIPDSGTIKKWHFYGVAQIDVYPDIYFDLPNFEEISREILPRVRYHKTKHGCELSVTHIENGIRSDKPILLIDGIPAESYCFVYPLQSKDIEHIEVLSGMRISGNLEYNGLVSIFTTSEYKLAKGKEASQSAYLVNGYQSGVSFERNPAKRDDRLTRHTPDFQNLLYWNPMLNSGSIAEFYTSDENASYVIDLKGVTSEGEKIHTQMEFSVKLN